MPERKDEGNYTVYIIFMLTSKVEARCPDLHPSYLNSVQNNALDVS